MQDSSTNDSDDETPQVIVNKALSIERTGTLNTYVGRDISKVFGGDTYKGKVVLLHRLTRKAKQAVPIFKVLFDDGDQADYEIHELLDILTPRFSPLKRFARKSPRRQRRQRLPTTVWLMSLLLAFLIQVPIIYSWPLNS